MKVRILYFASLREAVGREREEVSLPQDVVSAGQLRAWLRERGGAWQQELASSRAVRIAVNQQMANEQTPICADAEIAFFPPVTGG
ncbi:MAG: molybdopterin converting factor subunit 1 [Quisquiliibacterium sp.]